MEISFTEILLRLLIATLLGSVLGWERALNEHNAGLRTNALVALGTALFTIISGYAFGEFARYPHIQIDPTRIASYVVAGIGFLGGGTIFLRRDSNRVRGLTSAATIWIVAAVGMACGAGLYVPACSATAIALFVLIGLKLIEPYLFPKRNRGQYFIKLRFDTAQVERSVEKMYHILNKCLIEVDTIKGEEEGGIAEAVFTLSCQIKQEEDMMVVLDKLRQLDGIKEVTLTRHKGILTEDLDG
jgi:Uncharacterized membrane protein